MAALPRVEVAHSVFVAEELISLVAHGRVVDPGQGPVPFYELLSGQPATARQGPEFGDLNAVARHVVRLARLHRVHDGCGVVAELPLADDLHATKVAPCSSPGYAG